MSLLLLFNESSGVAQTARFDNVNTFYTGGVARGLLVPMQLELDGQGIELDGQPLQLMVFVEEGSILQNTRLNNANTFYGGTVTLGGSSSVTQSARFDNANTFYSGAVSRTIAQSTRFDNANTFYSGSITQGAAQIVQVGRFDNGTVFYGGAIAGGAQSNNLGFLLVDIEPRQWWKRKPKKLPAEKAKVKIKEIAEVLTESFEEPQTTIVERIRPLLLDMPGFDWKPLYQAIFEIRQAELKRQREVLARAEAERLIAQAIQKARDQDEEDVAILLLSM